MEKQWNKAEEIIKKYDENFTSNDGGELLNGKILFEEVKHAIDFENKKKSVKLAINLSNNLGVKLKRIGRYCMIYQENITSLNLTDDEILIWVKLTSKLALDGTCIIHSKSKTWTDWGKELNISRNRIKPILESLMNKNLIYFCDAKQILINPNFYGYGKYVCNKTAIEVFKLKIEDKNNI